MNEEKYRQLCDVCDQILMERKEAPGRLAIAWLHILREHPALLEPYLRLFSGRDFVSRLQWLGWARALDCFLRLVRQLCWAMYCSIAECKRNSKQEQKVDVLLVSHMLEKGAGHTVDDMYFGPIARVLSQRGVRVGVLYISHARKRPLSTRELETKSGVRRFVLGRTMPLQSELGILNLLIKESTLLRAASRTYQGLGRSVTAVAAAEALAPPTFNSLRIGSQVEAMVAELAPDFLLTTFEGHAWERCVFMKAHALFPHIKCFAYQHSATFRLQHSMNRPFGNGADPDLVLSTGPVAAQQLSSSWGPAKNLMIGSPKAKALQVSIGKKRSGAGNRCLVLPEGIESEAILLTAFCFECATTMPDVVFVLRFHPVFNYQALIKQSPQFSKLPPNVEISTDRSLEEDASSASYAIYRGSTAVIGAIERGAVPVYLARNDEMTIDPLFALKAARQVIKSVEEFVDLTKAGTYPRYESEAVVTHCKEIFAPLNIDAFLGVLGATMEKNGLQHEEK